MKLTIYHLNILNISLHFYTVLAASPARYGQGCAGASEINGNWYCSDSVQAITFTGYKSSGSYSRVISMDHGNCSQESQGFDSALGPFGNGNDISWHFRGPLQLKEFAFYTFGVSQDEKQELRARLEKFRRRQNQSHSHGRRHLLRLAKRLNHVQERHVISEAIRKRAVCDPVTATFPNGDVKTWINLWNGVTNLPASVCDQMPATSTAASQELPEDSVTTITETIWQTDLTITSTIHHTTSTVTVVSVSQSPAFTSKSSVCASPSSSPSSAILSSSSSLAPTPTFLSSATVPASSSIVASTSATMPAVPSSSIAGVYARQAYYNAAEKSSNGIVSLNNMGGQGSGVFDTSFGNSLSYASSDGSKGSKGPQTFNGYLAESLELAIYSDQQCNTGSICGFSRPGAVAHQGFDHSEALFFLDFQMPSTGHAGARLDMPAAWILNGQIARTGEYSSCSCWSSGCGEQDIFEVLDSGNHRMKATWHGEQDNSGGSSYWFNRPIDASQKAGVLLSEGNASVTIFFLPNDVMFSQNVKVTDVRKWMDDALGSGTMFSL